MELEAKTTAVSQSPDLIAEVSDWQALPNKGVFFPLLIAWILLFQFVGNPTFGYVDTSSLFWWMAVSYGILTGNSDDGHGLLIPPVVVGLLWWKRKELLALPNRLWWPAVFLLVGALVVHVVAYIVQQPRISIVAFYGGVYALMGLAWGPAWLRNTFFPMFLFVFCVPIASIGDPVTFHLRRLVTSIAGFISGGLLGMDVHSEGTQLYNTAHTFTYEVAAACSGMRSFIAIVVLTIIYGFVCFDKSWKRGLIIFSALPLSVIGNVIRLLCIVISADIWGRSTGDYVHENWFFSLIPYVPAIIGVMMLGRWLGERPTEPLAAAHSSSA